jgi:glycosyltransferase involved in cell wall biosynthesis
MHVGLNLIFLVPGETGGMEVYARELIPQLVAQRPDLQFTAFINREAAAAGDGPWGELIPAVTVPVNARDRVEWVRGEQQYLPRAASLHNVDLMHSLASTAPAWGPFRRVVTIHDVMYKAHPEAHIGLRTLGMRVLVPLAIHRSDRVIAISESTRTDIERFFGTPPAKVDVVPQGAGGSPGPATPADELRGRLGLAGRRVVLTVSAQRPVKNHGPLIEAIGLIPPERRPLLLIAGPAYDDDYGAELRERARRSGVEADLRWLGWISDADLEGLYGLADVFAFPSLYEGFGFPVIEAMRRGVPVASSDRSSLPEVAGDAVLYFDPTDPASIARAVEEILGDPGEAELMRAAGRAQAERFTWAETARKTLGAYDRVLREAVR